jgi:hypothetical protein
VECSDETMDVLRKFVMGCTAASGRTIAGR